MITFDDFAKVDIKVGKILSAEKVPDTDKLLKLSVDFGPKVEPVATIAASGPIAGATAPAGQSVPVAEVVMTEAARDVRQIVSGISMYFPDPQTLVGKKCMFVANLEPRKIRGLESNGMLFAVSTPDGKFSLLEPNADIPEGTKAK
jgi:methionyl-tRNA synthetase